MRLVPRNLGHVIGAAVALTAAACGSATRPATSPTSAPGATAPTTVTPTTTTLPTTTTTSEAAAVTSDVRVYFLRGEKLDVAHRTIAGTPQIATAAVTELLAGPTTAEVSAGMATTIPAGTRLRGISINGGIATVDLTGVFASGGGSLSMVGRLAQITYTLTQFPTVDRVMFHLDGKPVTVFGGEGLILDHPANRASFESLTPAILVEFPGRGWAVSSPLRVAGTANVFEAQFQAELADRTGTVIARQAILATSGSGTRGTFATTIAFTVVASGPGTLTVFDVSAKDGSRIDVVKIPVQLVAP